MSKQPKCSLKTCDKPAAPGKKMCDEHRKIYADRAATQRAKRIEAGKCITPGCTQTRGLSAGGRCRKCREKNAAGAKVAAETRMEAGLCRNAHAGEQRPAKEDCTLCQECIDKLSATSSEHYERRKEEGTCFYCASKPLKGYAVCKHHLEHQRNARRQLKLDALNAYGGPQCAKCPHDNVETLEIDHIDGGGRQHRIAEEIEGGTAFYQWLKNNKYPKGFRVLCPTCNKQAHVDSMKPTRK